MFFIVLAIVSVVVAVWWQVLPPTYFTNDDVMFRLLIEGRAAPGQPPTGFLINSHSALGWLLVWIRAHSPVRFVWDWTLASVFIVGVAAFIGTALKAGHTWTTRALAVFTLLVALIPLISGVQFTVSAAIAGGAAFALACQELVRAHSPRRAAMVSSGVLMLAGLLVRPLGAIAGAMAAGTTFVFTSWAAGRLTRRALIRIASTGVAAVAMFVAVSYGDVLIYRSSPSWMVAHDNHARLVRIFDWSGGPTNTDADAIRAATGWTPNDLELLRRWWGVDPVLHGPELVARADEAFQHSRGPNGGSPMFGLLLRPFNGAAFVDTLQQSAPAFVAMAILIGVTWQRARGLGMAAAIGAGIAFYLAVQVATKDLPWYLVTPLSVCLVGGAVAACASVPARRDFLLRAGLVLLGLLVAWETNGTVASEIAENRQAVEIGGQVIEFDQLHPALVVGQADAFPLEYLWRPFHDPPIRLPLIQLSFDNQTPLLQGFLTSAGMQPLLRTMCAAPGIIVVSEEDRLRLVTRYWSEHLHADVTWTRVFDGTFRAWRCTVARSAPERLSSAGDEAGQIESGVRAVDR